MPFSQMGSKSKVINQSIVTILAWMAISWMKSSWRNCSKKFRKKCSWLEMGLRTLKNKLEKWRSGMSSTRRRKLGNLRIKRITNSPHSKDFWCEFVKKSRCLRQLNGLYFDNLMSNNWLNEHYLIKWAKFYISKLFFSINHLAKIKTS